MTITKEQRGKLYHELVELQREAEKTASDAEGTEHHDAYVVVNIYDELRACIYTAKRSQQFNKKVELARRMAGMIGDDELQAEVIERLNNYEL